METDTRHDWLDKHIREQAAHYGLTPEQHARIQHDAAKVQEQIESGEIQENLKEW